MTSEQTKDLQKQGHRGEPDQNQWLLWHQALAASRAADALERIAAALEGNDAE